MLWSTVSNAALRSSSTSTDILPESELKRISFIILMSALCSVLFSSLLALNGGGRFLSSSSPLSSLLCSLVSWETLSALLSKLKYYGLTGLLMKLTLSKLGFRGTWLPRRNVRSGLYDGRVGEVANRVSGGSFRGGHWYLPIRNHDNRYFADWIRLCPGLSKNSENGNSCPKPHKAARMIEAVGRAVSIETETIIAIWILPRRSSRLYKGKLIKMETKMVKMDRE